MSELNIVANELALMMDKDMIHHINADADARQESKRTFAVILTDLVRVYSAANVVRFPVPGSKRKAGETNQITDYYPTVTVKKDGTKGEGQGSWYSDFYDASPIGTAHAKLVSDHQAVKETTGDQIWWDSEQARLTSRRTNQINSIKNAVKLFRQLARVKSEIDNADCTIIYSDDNKTNVTSSQKNIYLWELNGNNAPTGNFKLMTTGQFMALSVDKAVEKKGTYADLISTTGRGAGDGKDGKYPVPEKTDQADHAISAVGHWFEALANDDKKRKAFLTMLNGAGSDELLMTLDNIMVQIEGYLGMPGIKARVDALSEAGGLRAVRTMKQAKAA